MTYAALRQPGWFETNTDGLDIVYLAIIDEAVLTRPTDTPANTRYRPRILNPEQFHVLCNPQVWVWDNSESQLTSATFTELEIDNYDGAFTYLTRGDIRDAKIAFKLVPAGMLAGSTTVASAPVVATAIVDDVVLDGDVLRITLKDVLATFDRPLLSRFNEPFVDDSSANQMCPQVYGACRNIPLQVIDGGLLILRASDSALSNIATIRDKGAPLDTNANPPQYVPALNRQGVQLAQPNAGLLLADVSNIGEQGIQPGVADVLSQVGLLRSTTNPTTLGPGVTTWTGPASPSTSPPSGFTYMSVIPSGGSFIRYLASNGFEQDWAMGIVSQTKYDLSGVRGVYCSITTPFLIPGQHYRVSLILDRCYRPQFPDGQGGLLVRTNVNTSPVDDVSGPYLAPLTAPSIGGQYYAFDYEAPSDGVTRTLYFIGVGDPTLPPMSLAWHGCTVEQLGQFAELPLEGISFNQFWYNVLIQRDYQPVGCYSTADLTLLDSAPSPSLPTAGPGYTFGVYCSTPPNLRDLICAPLNSVTAAAFSDRLGVLRARRLIDPTDPDGPAARAAFDLTNTERSISIEGDKAQYLTTLLGVRRNWKQSGDDDLVSDPDIVPLEVRERYKRKSQYQVTASSLPAGEYAFAVGAPALDTLLDDPDEGQAEIDRVINIYKPKVYRDGTVHNGKRNFVTFMAHFDDVISLGRGTTCAAYDLLFGDIILLTYATHGFNNTRLLVVGTDLYPFAQKIQIRGFY